jgi:hypothetical protein
MTWFQDNCDHETITHSLMNGNIWEKCIFCDKAWYAQEGPKMKPYNPPKIRTIGDIWRYPWATSPYQSEQWGYMGTTKTPYVITHYLTKRDGSTTQDGWACSCMNFTQNAPRTPCKHILLVMLKEGATPSGASAKAAKTSALMSDADVKAFEKWKREQAEKGEIKSTAGAELQLFGAKGRKFR